MAIDFTGGDPAAIDLTLWWQYCGNNSKSSGNPDPAGVERLREITDGSADGSTTPVTEIADPAQRLSMVTEFVDILNEQYLFKNVVDMVQAQGIKDDLKVSFLNNYWIDWLNTYWEN